MLHVDVVLYLQLLAAIVLAIAVFAVEYPRLVLLWYYLLLKNTKLIAARVARRLTQEQLAELVGVTPREVQRWESEARHPHERNLYALSTVLERSPEELVFGVQYSEDQYNENVTKYGHPASTRNPMYDST